MAAEVTETVRTAGEWLQIVGIGAVAGMIGQGVRVAVGLKKVNDAAEESGRPFGELFSGAKLAVSLLIGSIAGALTAFFMGIDVTSIPMAQIIGLMAAGYAGADAIEGFISRILPKVPEATTGSAGDTARTADAGSDGYLG